MSRLANKVVVVTGASKGIGAAIAKQLGANGASVVVNYATSKEGADAVVEEIVANGGKAIAVKANVSSQADINHLFDETYKAYGRLDILVNNAGVYEFSALEAITEEHFNRQFNTNVLGLLLTTKKAAEFFDDKGGSVINISSLVAQSPVAGGSVYSATKGAVDAISKSLSKELGARNIRVNSLSPGLIETEGTHTAQFVGSDFHKQIEATTPLGRTGQPDDIAKAALFLASDDSVWVTGEAIVAAGGFR